MDDVDRVRAKYEQLRWVMDERVTRLWAAAEAESLGHGGIATVVKATGISKSRIRAGIRDLLELVHHPATPSLRWLGDEEQGEVSQELKAMGHRVSATKVGLTLTSSRRA